MGLVTAKVNNSLQNKNNVRAEQINVKIFFVLITASSQVEHIFSFDIVELITVFSVHCSLRALGFDCKDFMQLVGGLVERVLSNNNTCH